jgi:DNA-binding protein WhiA
MSFGSEVKKELMNIDLNNVSEQRALVMAILHNSSELTASTENSKFEWKLTVRSTILSVIKFVAKYLKKHYNCSDQFKTKEKNNLNKFRYYYLEISNVDDVIKDFHLLDYHLENVTTNYLGLAHLELQNVYLRGLFITHGSISDPRVSTYHFEIATSHEPLAYLMKTIF